jgi:hypothetical protein
MGTMKPKFVAGMVLVILALSGPAAGVEKERIDIDAKDKPFHAVVAYIRDVTGASIELGENRDGLPLEKDEDLKVTMRLDGVHLMTALRLAASQAGVQIEALPGGRWRLFQHPRYILSLIDADLGVVVAMVAGLGDLNVVFRSDLLRGRKVTLRLTDLRWEKVLEVVVKTGGLVLVPIGKDGRRRIAPPKKGVAKEAEGAGDASETGKGVDYVVTAILKRTDGGRSGAVINGVFVEEGGLVPDAPMGAKPRLGKITSERFIVLEAGKARVRVSIVGSKGK